MYLLLNLIHCVKGSVWAFMSSFTMATHQLWSCDVTLATDFENLYFSSNSILNFRTSYQIWGKSAQEQKRYRQKIKLGVENTPPPPPPPPVLIGLIDVGRKRIYKLREVGR